MKKRLTLLIAAILIVIAGTILLYRHFKPAENNTRTVMASGSNEPLPFSKSIETLKNTPGNYLVFIYEQNADYEYIKNSFLSPILNDSDVSIPQITYVDTTGTKNLTVTQLRSAYNVERTPAFVNLTVKDNKEIEIKGVLTYFPDTPFSQDDFKQWLFDNQLWTGPFSVRN